MSTGPLVDTLAYLIGFYWPYLAAAVVVGSVVGWFSVSARKG